MRVITLFKEALEGYNVDSAKIEQLCNELTSMIVNYKSPRHYWTLIGSGCFKECYDIGEDIVVKFASTENETEQEVNIVCRAMDAGVGDIFLPSIFIPLDCFRLPASFLEGYDYEYEDEGGSKFDYIIIQKKITGTVYKLYGGTNNEYVRDSYDKDFLRDEDGEKISYDALLMVGILNKMWLNSFIKKFGSATLYDLGAFNEMNNIGDLHNCNIGFLPDDTPVIIDWLS